MATLLGLYDEVLQGEKQAVGNYKLNEILKMWT
jgi:hypothetical protein